MFAAIVINALLRTLVGATHSTRLSYYKKAVGSGMTKRRFFTANLDHGQNLTFQWSKYVMSKNHISRSECCIAAILAPY
jgi:hypothetical protein